MSQLYQSAFLEALGWSLIDSLWQMGAIWVLYSLLTLNGKKYSASQKHMLALLGMAGGTLWFFFTLGINYYYISNDRSLLSISYYFREGIGVSLDNWPAIMNIAVPVLSSLYLLSITIYIFRLLVHYKSGTSLYRESLIPPDNNIINYLSRLCEKIKPSKKIRIWLSSNVESPLTIGFLKPLILLPVAVLNQLTPQQAEAVIAHELFHIRRNDYLLNLLLIGAEIIFFFNPFSRILSGIIRKERENSCDDRVLSLGFDSWEYSQALYILGRYGSSNNKLVLAATGTRNEYLLQRVKRLMKFRNSAPSLIKPVFTFFLCLFVAVLAGNRTEEIQVLPEIHDNSEQAVYIEKAPPDVKPVAPEIIEGTVNAPPPAPKKSKNQPSPIGLNPHSEASAGRELESKSLAPGKEAEGKVREKSSNEENRYGYALTFVHSADILEFSIIEHKLPAPQQPATGERLLPYVPGSTFYFPTDSTGTVKKEIRL